MAEIIQLRNHNAPPAGGVIAFDLSRMTGFAYGLVTDDDPVFGRFPLPEVGGEGARYVALQEKIDELLARYKPKCMILENPLPPQAQTHTNSMLQQVGLRSIAIAEAYRQSVAVHGVDAGTVRQDLLGRRNFAKGTVKKEVLRFCLRRGWKVPDHNSGDACLVWLWMSRRLRGIPSSAGPLWTEADFRPAWA